MRQNPLFLPPNDTIVDLLAKQPCKRRWWHSSIAGSSAPGDALIDRHGETVTMGVLGMTARLNNTSSSFDCAVDNLALTAQVLMSGEQCGN